MVVGGGGILGLMGSILGWGCWMTPHHPLCTYV